MGANGQHWKTMSQTPSELTEYHYLVLSNNNQQYPAISTNVRQHPLSYTNIYQYTFQRGVYNSLRLWSHYKSISSRDHPAEIYSLPRTKIRTWIRVMEKTPGVHKLLPKKTNYKIKTTIAMRRIYMNKNTSRNHHHLFNLPSSSTQSHNRICTSLAFSKNALIFSGAVANLQPPSATPAVAIPDTGDEITGMFVEDEGP